MVGTLCSKTRETSLETEVRDNVRVGDCLSVCVPVDFVSRKNGAPTGDDFADSDLHP